MFEYRRDFNQNYVQAQSALKVYYVPWEEQYSSTNNSNQAFPFSALTLLLGRQEGHPVCKKTGCWFVGVDDVTGALHPWSVVTTHHLRHPLLQ